MKEITKFSEIVEENGKTIRENNLTIEPKYPIGARVEVTLNECYGTNPYTGIEGIATLFVVDHIRDCDGTPLYVLASKPQNSN